MYRVLDRSHGTMVGIKIQGPFTSEDYEGLLQYFKDLREEMETLNLLFDLTHLEEEGKSQKWSQLVVELQEQAWIRRMAIAGDRPQWVPRAGEDMGTDSHMEVKNFLPNQIDQAWKWLNEP